MPGRPYVSANYWFQCDGFDCGQISKVSGGYISADVQEIAQNGGFFVKKTLGAIKHNAAKLDFAGIQGGPIYDRIVALLNANHQYFNAGIYACDFNLQTKAIREFTNCLLTSVTMPECDGSKGKDPAYLSIEYEPEHTKMIKGDGSKPTGVTNVAQKKLSKQNFQFHCDNIKDACVRVNKVDALTVKLATTRDQIGFGRIYECVPAKGVTYPNISFTLPEADAEPIWAWHQKFVVEGNCTEADETSAELVYYDNSLKNELISVTFRNVGIFNCQPDDNKDQDESIRRVKVECYCEKIDIAFKNVS